MIDLLHAFARWLEDFSGRHAHSIALLEAVSTTVAVIVALTASYAAKRANLPRLVARVSVSRYISENDWYITVWLSNVVTVPIRLHSNLLSWRLRFSKVAWLAQPVDTSHEIWHPRREYPFVLLPRRSETIFLSILEDFKLAMPQILDSGRFGRKISARLLRGIIYTDDGSHFRANVAGLRRALKEL
jgi:hypothetical protein